jgi:hypothetical protein
MGTERINFTLMQENYEQYRDDSAPCKSPGISNQCAVRMSLALVRNGFSLDDFPNQRRVHQGRTRCALGDDAHVVGADELHRYLSQVWDTGLRGEGTEFRSQLIGNRGVIYFNNCFHRSSDPEGESRGDHIDLWDGEHYYNQLLRVSAGGTARVGTDLFAAASFVRFFWLPT